MTIDPRTIAADIMTDYARDVGRMDITAYVMQKNDGIISASLIDELADLIEKTGVELIWPDDTRHTELDAARAELEQVRESARYYSAQVADLADKLHKANAQVHSLEKATTAYANENAQIRRALREAINGVSHVWDKDRIDWVPVAEYVSAKRAGVAR